SPYWARIESLRELRHESAIEITIVTYWESDPALLAVPILPVQPTELHRKLRITVDGTTWSRSSQPDGGVTFRRTVPLSGVLGPCELILAFKGLEIDRQRIGLGFPRLYAHELVDPEFLILQERLDPKFARQKPDKFEEGVAWLLHLCGFSSVHYG